MAFNRMGTYRELKREFLLNQCIALVDTSIIILIAQNVLKYEDLLSSVDNCILSVITPILDELKMMSFKQGKKGRLASWALNNLANKFFVIPIEGTYAHGDHAIVRFAKEFKEKIKLIVITADINLKNELINQGISVIWYRRAKNRLETVNIFN